MGGPGSGNNFTATIVLDSIVEYAVGRIAFCVRKYTLKREISLILFGPISEDKPDTPKETIKPASFEKICAKARKILQDRVAENVITGKHESIGFYEELLADPKIAARTKIKARENLDKITGNAPLELGIIPIEGTVKHHHINIDSLGLTIEQKKKLLEDTRGISSS